MVAPVDVTPGIGEKDVVASIHQADPDRIMSVPLRRHSAPPLPRTETREAAQCQK